MSSITDLLSMGTGKEGDSPAPFVVSGYFLSMRSIHCKAAYNAAASGHFDAWFVYSVLGSNKPPPVIS